MRRKREAGLAGLCALLLLAVLAGYAAREEQMSVGLCYRVTGGRNDMVILGSIHIGNEDMGRFGAHIAEAMREADTFVFECDSVSREAREEIQKLTQDEQPLQTRVSDETYALLGQACQKLGYSIEAFEGMRPWAVANTLSARTAAVEMGVKDASKALALGVENVVRSRAGGKALAYLETAGEQLGVLDGFSAPLQELMLKSACELILNPELTSLAQWPEWWTEGNVDEFTEAYRRENALSDPTLMEEYHSGLVTERNQRMANRLKALLEEREAHSYFVTIGLLHLTLPGDSVLHELEEMGYTVERMWPEG